MERHEGYMRDYFGGFEEGRPQDQSVNRGNARMYGTALSMKPTRKELVMAIRWDVSQSAKRTATF